jgi:hypothetical protein
MEGKINSTDSSSPY